MNKTLSLLFYLKRSKINKKGLAPLYLRITVDGIRWEISCKRYINPTIWNGDRQKLNGTGEESRNINAQLKSMELHIYEVYREMIEQNIPLTMSHLKCILSNNGESSNKKMLVPILEEHNERIKSLVGKEYASGTYQRYATSLKHTIDFLQWKYKVDDIDIKSIHHEFITSYDYFLLSDRSCNNNSTVKYLKNFKKTILICISNGWLDRDSFVKYKPKVKAVKRDFLTNEELEVMFKKKLHNERIEQVRDIFLFSCYTGLAYADVKKLKREEIIVGHDGQQWIFTSRQKTDTDSRIPLLNRAIELMNKYHNHPQCVDDGLVLPVLSNQKMKSYLKEIADIFNISKELTYHIARHTFATTVTLGNGVSIENSSKMLGYTNIKTTQHYAKILDQQVGKDMEMLSKKLSR